MIDLEKGRKPHIILIIGPPLSGKTTWAKNYLKSNAESIRVSKDEIMMMLRSSKISFEDVNEIADIAMSSLMYSALSKNKIIVVDHCPSDLSSITNFIVNFRDYNICYKIVDSELSELISRNTKKFRETGTTITQGFLIGKKAECRYITETLSKIENISPLIESTSLIGKHY